MQNSPIVLECAHLLSLFFLFPISSHNDRKSCVDDFYRNLTGRCKLEEHAQENEEVIIWSRKTLGADWPN